MATPTIEAMGADDLPAMRISDQDRAVVSRQLESAFADGRLDTEELASRLKIVNRAKFRSDLDETIVDLPAQSMGAVSRNSSTRPAIPGSAKQYSPFLLAPIICTLIYAMTDLGGYFWPMWVWFGCGLPVIIRLLNPDGETDVDGDE